MIVNDFSLIQTKIFILQLNTKSCVLRFYIVLKNPEIRKNKSISSGFADSQKYSTDSYSYKNIET